MRTAEYADGADRKKMIHEELSGKIIGFATEVLNELNPGLDEKLSERALIIELKRNGHGVETQRGFPVYYRGQLIGNLTPDLIVDGAVAVDPKVVATFTEARIAQMIGYLAITRLELALLSNFKSARLQWKRVVRQTNERTTRSADMNFFLSATSATSA